MANSFPFIHVEGSSYDRGFQLGQAARKQVLKSCEIYKEAFYRNGIEWKRVKELARDFIKTIKEYDQELMKEIYGIAEGAKQEVETIVALNARTELLYWETKNNKLDDQSSDECTGALSLPEVTANGCLLHGQNWDWRPECIESSVIVRHVPDKGPSFITFTEAGILSRCGLNNAGISVTGNFLRSDQDFGQSGIPIPFIRRRILTSTSLAQAISVVINTPRAFSSNHMIGDAGGYAINLESTPNEVFWIHPENGLLVHSNHFKNIAAKVKLIDIGIGSLPDSLYRDYRVKSYLDSHHGKITVEEFKKAFQDHYGKPDSVCRHASPRYNGTIIGTVASIIFNSTEGRMWVALGPVCENNFLEYSF